MNYLSVQKIIGIDKLNSIIFCYHLKDQPIGMDQKRWDAPWPSTVLEDLLVHQEWLEKRGVVQCQQSSLRPVEQPQKVQIYPDQVWGIQHRVLVLLELEYLVRKQSLVEEVVAVLGLEEAVVLVAVGMGILRFERKTSG